MTHSRDERLALAELLEEKGPDAPTLCAGWTTGDLAAHLVLRESRPDAAAGVMGGPLAGYTARAQDRLKSRMSFSELVAAFRNGPPRFSPFALPRLDEAANTVEYFVHHEDVRRGEGDWAPRDLDPELADALWGRLKSGARFFVRSAPVGVELARDESAANGGGPGATASGAGADGGAAGGGAGAGGAGDGGTGGAGGSTAGAGGAGGGAAGAGGSGAGPFRVTAKRTAPLVTVSGSPGELTLWAFGRVTASHVELDGPKAAINQLQAWRR
ncbi:MAG TPA: TIGR03085 family metal-binding protein [Trebonia sp.]|nr:TIGR03085 family metal-binding protein [Trebonia sp.]